MNKIQNILTPYTPYTPILLIPPIPLYPYTPYTPIPPMPLILLYLYTAISLIQSRFSMSSSKFKKHLVKFEFAAKSNSPLTS